MAIFALGIPDDQVEYTIAAIVSVRPAMTEEERELSAPQLANVRVQEYIRELVQEHERRTLVRAAETTARERARALPLYDPQRHPDGPPREEPDGPRTPRRIET